MTHPHTDEEALSAQEGITAADLQFDNDECTCIDYTATYQGMSAFDIPDEMLAHDEDCPRYTEEG